MKPGCPRVERARGAALRSELLIPSPCSFSGTQRIQLFHGQEPDQHGTDRWPAAGHGVCGTGARPHCGRLWQVQWQDVLPDFDGR